MERQIIQSDIESKISAIGGIKGILIKKVWPFIKEIVIDLLIDLLTKEKSKS